MATPFDKPVDSLVAKGALEARPTASADEVSARLMKIGKRYAEFPDTGKTPDDILGYDDDGLPT